MIQSIAIQAYFAQMRHFFTRQGFNLGTRVIYGGDAQGNLDLLDKDLANYNMPRKATTTRETVRSNPYTYLFWTKGTVENINRRSVRIRDGISPTGHPIFKKYVSVKFPLQLAYLSNKGNTIEDFEEAYAAEWQNIHNAPLSLKWAFPAEAAKLKADGEVNPDLWMNATVIQNLGSSELVSYRLGNLFAYSWTAWIHLNFVSEFASVTLKRLKNIVVDLYNPEGIPLASIGAKNSPTFKVGEVPDTGTGEPGPGYVRIPENTPLDPPAVADYESAVIGPDGKPIVVKDVPVIPFFEKSAST